MAVSIGALKYSLIAETAQFEKGVVASRKELSAARKVMLDTQTPLEKYQMELEGMRRLLQKGAIDQKTFTRASRALEKQLEEATRDTDRFGRALAFIPARMRPAARSVIAFATSLRGLAVAYGVATAARKTAGAIFGQIAEVDRLTKAARKLGTTVDELQALRLAAAEFSGMADTQLDTALQRMTRRISEAAAGTGEAQKAISELGLDAQRLNQLGPAGAFKKIADAIQKVHNPADRLRLSFKFFDSEGAALATTLAEGSEGIDEMNQRIQELNLSLGKDTTDAIEKANDELTEMKAAWGGLAREFTAFVLPILRAGAWLLSKIAQLLAWIIRNARQGAESIKNLFAGAGFSPNAAFLSSNTVRGAPIATTTANQQKQQTNMLAQFLYNSSVANRHNLVRTPRVVGVP